MRGERVEIKCFYEGRAYIYYSLNQKYAVKDNRRYFAPFSEFTHVVRRVSRCPPFHFRVLSPTKFAPLTAMYVT